MARSRAGRRSRFEQLDERLARDRFRFGEDVARVLSVRMSERDLSAKAVARRTRMPQHRVFDITQEGWAPTLVELGKLATAFGLRVAVTLVPAGGVDTGAATDAGVDSAAGAETRAVAGSGAADVCGDTPAEAFDGDLRAPRDPGAREWTLAEINWWNVTVCIGDEVAWAMREDQLTHDELAARVGVAPGRISLWTLSVEPPPARSFLDRVGAWARRICPAGDIHMTTDALLRMAAALDRRVSVSFEPHVPQIGVATTTAAPAAVRGPGAGPPASGRQVER